MSDRQRVYASPTSCCSPRTCGKRIHEQREQNAFFRAVDDAFEQEKFPPFPVIARYLAPGGSLLINEETGLHYIRFTLRRQTTTP